MKELNFEQMENIQAGVSAKEYCKTIQMIYDHNEDERDTEGMGVARGICSFYGYPVG
ncbi:hypothetical protein [Marinifilum caeruleilacunae]|uniref:hypothetical protein n=1 Tax=Marinifilum caeruleilacunae TaxID=2499076 RepID=UPI0014925F76|nr:hypothetical protein [Marinifilum caeruleilacunae]